MPLQKPNFDLDVNYQQLALELDLPEIESEGVSAEEARQRSEAGRSALFLMKGSDDQPSWYKTFERLLEGGWPWRQATYIAWASIPKEARSHETQDELARKYLRLTSDRVIATWRRRNPAIDETIALLTSAPLWDHRAEVIDALIKVATAPDYKGHNDRKLFLELTGDYIPASKLEAILRSKGVGNDIETEDETLVSQVEKAALKMQGDVAKSKSAVEEDEEPE